MNPSESDCKRQRAHQKVDKGYFSAHPERNPHSQETQGRGTISPIIRKKQNLNKNQKIVLHDFAYNLKTGSFLNEKLAFLCTTAEAAANFAIWRVL